MREYRRGEGDWGDGLAAAGIGAAAGLVAFYLARLWLRREPLDERGSLDPGRRAPAARGRRAGGGAEREEPGRPPASGP